MSNKKTPNAGKGPTKSLGIGAVTQRKSQGREQGKPIQYTGETGRVK